MPIEYWLALGGLALALFVSGMLLLSATRWGKPSYNEMNRDTDMVTSASPKETL